MDHAPVVRFQISHVFLLKLLRGTSDADQLFGALRIQQRRTLTNITDHDLPSRLPIASPLLPSPEIVTRALQAQVVVAGED